MRGVLALMVGVGLLGCSCLCSAEAGFRLENDFAKLAVASDGSPVGLIDKASGKDYCLPRAGGRFASVRKGGKNYACTSVSRTGAVITLKFGDSGVEAVLKAESRKRWFTFEVVEVRGEGVDGLAFLDLAFRLKGRTGEPFAACALALNLKTNVPEIPGLNSTAQAICYARFGFEGAKAALVACPTSKMRKVLQEVVSAAPEIVKSSVGGPWALDAAINRGSYLFNFGDLTEETVGDWIALAHRLGTNQIDFHGGNSFRFGDCRPNPKMYPNGRASLKAVIDKLHAAGIKAGLHTYAFFMDKGCPWVSPKPDARLGADAVFTLANDIGADAADVPVVESTEKMSTITGFFERNSVTLRIDDELITYSGVSRQPPYSFTGCKRGACGTRAAPHAKGAKAHHLKECFGLFAPEGDSTLLDEVAAASADMFNECGFDMMYLDALDGEDVLGGAEWGWHYGSKFVFELVKRLARPALMEMSTFHHHLWFVRSRIGAMDHPGRSQKRFIDIHCGGEGQIVHCQGFDGAARMFLPAEMGWWTLVMAGDQQVERTFPDDIEYLMCKCLATNTGFALMGIDPSTYASTPALQQLAPIFGAYERLRHSGKVPESVRSKLLRPGAEFTLEEGNKGEWRFRPIEYAKHKVAGSGDGGEWVVRNRFARQPMALRIEPLFSVAAYDSADAVTIADFAADGEFAERSAQDGVTLRVTFGEPPASVGGAFPTVARFAATSSRKQRANAWAMARKVFEPALDLSKQQGLGVWVHGDGQGEVLNFQVKSPQHLAWGSGDHFVKVDFKGWRYFELVEPEGERVNDYRWPYENDIYGIYREKVNYSAVGSLSIWLNNLPPGREANCYIAPVRALPLVAGKIVNPKVSANGKSMTFPVSIETGSYLEFRGPGDCKVFGPKGELVCELKPEGEIPILERGENRVTFDCNAQGTLGARAWVTVISKSAQVIQ